MLYGPGQTGGMILERWLAVVEELSYKMSLVMVHNEDLPSVGMGFTDAAVLEGFSEDGYCPLLTGISLQRSDCGLQPCMLSVYLTIKNCLAQRQT